MKSRTDKKNRGANNHSGFTLVEMLIVVAIIGILAAIAIPQFNSYRENAYCARVKSDLANLAISQEGYFYDYDIYVAITRAGDGSSNISNFFWSEGVALDSSAGDTSSWTAVVSHANCSRGPFTWDSNAGGLQ